MSAEQSRDGNNRFRRANTEVEHDAEAARLRGEGLSYKAIGERMGCSKGTAFARVHRAFRDTLAEPAEQARAVELARLENAHDTLIELLSHPKVTAAHIIQIAERIRTLSESRRKLLGLDAPQKVALTTEAIDAELADTEAAIAAELALARGEESETPGTEGGES